MAAMLYCWAGSALVPIGSLVTLVSLSPLLKMDHAQTQCCGTRAGLKHRQKDFSSELQVWLSCEKGEFYVGPTAELMNERYNRIDFYPKRNRVNLSPSLGQIALCRVGSKPHGKRWTSHQITICLEEHFQK